MTNTKEKKIDHDLPTLKEERFSSFNQWKNAGLDDSISESK